MSKKRFKVYVTATVGTVIEIEADGRDEAVEKAELRWTTGEGGVIGLDDMEATNVQFDVVGEE